MWGGVVLGNTSLPISPGSMPVGSRGRCLPATGIKATSGFPSGAEPADPRAVQLAEGAASAAAVLHGAAALHAPEGAVSGDPHAVHHDQVSKGRGTGSFWLVRMRAFSGQGNRARGSGYRFLVDSPVMLSPPEMH